MNDQNQTDPNQPVTSSPPSVSDQPPTPAFQTTDSTQTSPMTDPVQNTNPADQQNNNQNTPQPSDNFSPSTMETVKPTKKFGGGKIIATILGFFVLVGGIAGGVILTQQQQDIREKASGEKTSGASLSTKATFPPGGNLGGGTGTKTTGSIGKEVDGVPNATFPPGGNLGGGTGTKTTGSIGKEVDGVPNATFPPGGNLGGGLSSDNSKGTQVGENLTNCGGTFCNKDDCHCQGGDACTSLKCEPNIKTGCINSGRAWCENHQDGQGKTCCVAGYVCNPNGEGCVPGGGGKNTPPPGTNPPSGPTAQCLNVKAFNASFTQLTPTQLSQLKSGDKVRFTVGGQATAGSFQKARFTINGTLRPEVTGKRPGTEEFFDEFTIPAGVSNFSISAQIFHSSLGWK